MFHKGNREVTAVTLSMSKRARRALVLTRGLGEEKDDLVSVAGGTGYSLTGVDSYGVGCCISRCGCGRSRSCSLASRVTIIFVLRLVKERLGNIRGSASSLFWGSVRSLFRWNYEVW